MAYNIRKENLERWKDELAKITDSATVLPFLLETKEPKALLYELHQARATARELNKRLYKKLAPLRFRTHKKGVLVDKKLDYEDYRPTAFSTVPKEEATQQNRKEAEHFDSRSALAMDGETAIDVVATLNIISEEVTLVSFPDYSDKILPVERWCEVKGTFSIIQENPLILRRNNVPADSK